MKKIIFSLVLLLTASSSFGQSLDLQLVNNNAYYNQIIEHDNSLFLVGFLGTGIKMNRQNLFSELTPMKINTNAGMIDISFMDANIGFMVDGLGYIHKTTDAGLTWDSTRFSNLAIFGLQALNNSVYIASNEGVYISNDLGVSFQSLNLNGIFQNIGFSDVHFFNSNEGLAIQSFPANESFIYRTVNGGVNWDTVYFNTNQYSVQRFEFVNDSVGFAYGSVVLKTTDGGLTWSPEFSGFSSLRLSALNEDDFLVAPFGSQRFSYVSNGILKNSTPAPFEPNISQNYFTSIYPLSSDSILLSTLFGELFLTPDSGDTWQRLNNNTITSNYIDFFNMQGDSLLLGDGEFGGMPNLFYKHIPGIGWRRLNPLAPNGTIQHSYVVNDSIILTVNDNGVNQSVYNGTNFISSQLIAKSQLYKLSFKDNLGFVAGSSGAVYRTIDRGQTWDSIGINTTVFMNSVLIGNTTILALGDDGYLARSTDDGVTFTSIASSFNTDLITGVQLADSSIIVVGESRIIKSIDNGDTWYEVSSIDKYFRDVQFLNDEVGIASGDDVIAYTLDRGENWVSFPVFFGVFSNVKVVSDTEAMVLGNLGNTFKITFEEGEVMSIRYSLPKNESIRIFPNPSSSSIILDSENAIHSYQVFDLKGIKVKEDVVINNQINIEDLPQGFYLLSCFTKDGILMETNSFVKK